MFNTENDIKEALNRPIQKLITGIDYLDENMGVCDNDFIMVGAGTGHGKSTFCLSIACNMAQNNQKVLYLNLEVSKATYWNKVSESGFDRTKDFGELDSSGKAKYLHVIGKEILPKKILNVKWLKTIIKSEGYKCVVIDTFEPFAKSNYGMERLTDSHVANIAMELHDIAEYMSCAVIITSQIGKKGGRNWRPTTDDVKGFNSLSEKIMKVFIIYRLTKVQVELTMQKDEKVVPNIVHHCTEIIVSKNRNHSKKLPLPEGIFLTKYWNGKLIKLTATEHDLYTKFISGKKLK